MGITFTSSITSKKIDSHRILLNLSDKVNFKRSDKCFALSKLSIDYTWTNKKTIREQKI